MAIIRSEITQEELKDIKRRIRKLGLTQKEFAEVVGYSKGFLSTFLSGWLYSKRAHQRIIQKLQELENTEKHRG